MVLEDDADEATPDESVQAAFPLRLGIGSDDDGDPYPPIAPVDMVAVRHGRYPRGTIVIDREGVYLNDYGLRRQLFHWAELSDGSDPDILIV